MGTIVAVRSGDAEFFVETIGDAGVTTVSGDSVLSFEHVQETLQAIAEQVEAVWRRVKPAEASVEFGLNLTAQSGKLTGLLVEGGGSASLKVKMTWKNET
jgi:hypothetical protein